jgi:hypothetical protein
VRKKLTELEVFRYNFRERLWVKCGSAEEAEANQRLAEQEAERRRLSRVEAERVERERLALVWEADRKRRQEIERLKAEADQAERERLSRPAVAGWHDFIPEELKPTALATLIRIRRLSEGQTLDDLSTSSADYCLRQGGGWFTEILRSQYDREMRRVAEAGSVAD